jgi:hypothetical protein
MANKNTFLTLNNPYYEIRLSEFNIQPACQNGYREVVNAIRQMARKKFISLNSIYVHRFTIEKKYSTEWDIINHPPIRKQTEVLRLKIAAVKLSVH